MKQENIDLVAANANVAFVKTSANWTRILKDFTTVKRNSRRSRAIAYEVYANYSFVFIECLLLCASTQRWLLKLAQF